MIFKFVSRLFVLAQYVIPKHAISRFTGALSGLRLSWMTHLAIHIFVKAYDVDMAEAAEPDIRSYPSFNAFSPVHWHPASVRWRMRGRRS